MRRTLSVIVEAAGVDDVEEVAGGFEGDVLNGELPVVISEARGGFE